MKSAFIGVFILQGIISFCRIMMMKGEGLMYGKWKVLGRYKNYFLVPLLIVIAPIILNFFVFSTKGPGLNGRLEDWIGFFSNYSGGIIGGIVAYLIAKSQTERIDREKIIDNKQIERLALQRVQFELSKIKQDFSDLKNVEIGEEEQTNSIPYRHFNIRKLNPNNWESIGQITNETLQKDLMELEDFYKDFRENLLDDGHAVKVKVDRLKNQLFEMERGSHDWFELEEERIHQENLLMFIESRRDYFWKEFKKIRNGLERLTNEIGDEVKRIEDYLQ